MIKIVITTIFATILIFPTFARQNSDSLDSLINKQVDFSMLELHSMPWTEGCDSVFHPYWNKIFYYNSDSIFRKMATEPIKDIFEEVWYLYHVLDQHIQERMPAEREKLLAASKKYKSKLLERELDVFDARYKWKFIPEQITVEMWDFSWKLVEKYERKNDLQTKLRIMHILLLECSGFPTILVSKRVEEERVPIIKLINEILTTMERLKYEPYLEFSEIYCHIGMIYFGFQFYDKAIPLLWKALEYPHSYDFERSQMRAREYLGAYYGLIKNDYQLSDSLLIATLQVHGNVLQRPVYDIAAIGFLAANSMSRNENEEAIKLYSIALPRALQAKDSTLAGGYAANLGRLFLANNELEKTEEMIHAARKYLIAGNLPLRNWKRYYTLNRDYYLKINKSEIAAAYIDSITSMQTHEDETYNARILAYAEQEAFESEKARKEQQIENQRTRLKLYSVILFLTLIAFGILLYAYKLKQKKNRQLYLQLKEQSHLAEKLENQQKENRELKALDKSEPQKVALSKEEADKEYFKQLNEIIKEQKLFSDSELKRKDIAAKIGLSDKETNECILNCIGMSFNEYLNDLRLQHARELLIKEGKKMTVEAIANMSGFNTRETFYTLFRKKFGITPGNLIKIAKKMEQ